jgi:acyl-CoA-dependent ceramide synthase
MDVSDIFLGIAKMQKYLGYENLCNVTFGCFMLSWIVTRHILYPKVLSSVIWRSEELLYFDWNPEQEYFWSKNTKLCFVVLLSALQILLILWFFMIVKIAVGVLRGAAAEDSRSDDEDEV